MTEADSKSRDMRRFILVLATAAFYLVSARLGLLLSFKHTNVSPVWPPTGVALAAILVLGYRVWPGIAAGAFLANYTTGLPVYTAGFISIGNTLEAVVGGLFVRRLVRGQDPFQSASDVFKFLLACGLCTSISATIGTSAVYFGGFHFGATFRYLWWIWWLGDTVGAITITPLILSWSKIKTLFSGWNRLTEATLILIGLLGMSIVVFSGWLRMGAPLVYATVPIVVLACFRFQQVGATVSLFLLSAIAIWGTIQGNGPFVAEHIHESLLILQCFIGVIAATALPVAAVVSERKRAEEINLSQLREKEVLVQEIHHRVKNNLQIISSLLSMQYEQSDPSARAVIAESRSRIQSMAMIHQRLYESDDLSRINLGPYLKELVTHICTSYGSPKQTVALQIDCEDAFVGIDKAVPVGLIVNEIVSNSLKHAFPPDQPGTVSLQLRCPEGRILLDLSDNGRGLPSEIDLKQSRSMGLKLISLLIEQLHAEVQIERSAGTRFHIEFE